MLQCDHRARVFFVKVIIPRMRRFRDITAYLLLVTFVTGGLLGPSLHRIQHALEQAAEEPCHTNAVHKADAPVVGDEDASVYATHCALCMSRLLVVLPTIEMLTIPMVGGDSSVELGMHLAPTDVFRDRFIRGPPSLS